MQPDLLQQLRDLHLPPDPTWWPPAIGWWLIAVLAIVGLVYVGRLARQAVERRRPLRRARVLYQQLHADYEKGVIDAPTYLHQANELLKRLFIHGLHDDRARKANDKIWLALLDERSGTASFTNGPGRQLGNQRFSMMPDADPDVLHPILAQFFKQVRP
jgi:hypothetical protein